MNHEDPVPLRDALAIVRKQLGVPNSSSVDEVAAAWLDVAGDDLAAHSRIRSLRSGECMIEVDGPVWATRARYLTGALRDRANERIGTPFLRVVKVAVSGPAETD